MNMNQPAIEKGATVVSLSDKGKGVRIGRTGVVKGRKLGHYKVKFGGRTAVLAPQDVRVVTDPSLPDRCLVYRYEFYTSTKGWMDCTGWRSPEIHWNEYLVDPLHGTHVLLDTGYDSGAPYSPVNYPRVTMLVGEHPLVIDAEGDFQCVERWSIGEPPLPGTECSPENLGNYEAFSVELTKRPWM